MSSDENADGQFDHTDLPATIPYDFQDLPSSPPLNQTTSSTPPTTAAPPTGSASNSNSTFQEHYSSELYTGSFHSSSSSSLEKLDNSLDSKELRDPQSQANRRLFRSQSNNMDSDIGMKRKFGFYQSEAAVEKRNLERGYSDLTNITTNRSMIPGYSDVQPFRGQIDQRQRRYLENDINVEGLTASLDSSNISSGETLLHLGKQSGSFSSASVNSFIEQNRTSSFSHSDHDHSGNSFPSNPTLSYSGPESDIVPTTALSPSAAAADSSIKADATTTGRIADTSVSPPSTPQPSTSYQVESSCPIDDLAFQQELEEESSSQHLQNYSPERNDDFAREVSLQLSSTPLQPQVASTFPDEDFANLQQSIRNNATQGDLDGDDDTSPPYNQQLKAPALQHIDKITSPFLDLSQTANQPSSRPTVSDHTPRAAGPNIRRLRSNSDLVTVAAARAASQYYIMFASTVDKQKYHRSVVAMGAMVVTHWDHCTHFVTDNTRKTTNLLCALASKKWIVSERWLEESIGKARFVDEDDHILIRQSTPNYFVNKKLFFCSTAKIKRTDTHDLAKAAGAKLRLKEPDMANADPTMVVISSNEPGDMRPYQMAGYETMDRDDFLAMYGRSDG